MSTIISQIGKEVTPDGLAILGVAEIENKKSTRRFGEAT